MPRFMSNPCRFWVARFQPATSLDPGHGLIIIRMAIQPYMRIGQRALPRQTFKHELQRVGPNMAENENYMISH